MNALAIELRDILAASPSLRAFLRMLRVGEGTVDDDGYRRMFAGELVDSFADHPRKPVTAKLGGKPITSTAAGAYQFLSRTWLECKQALDLPDFSPASQDVAAVYLVRRRKALPDVLAGRIEQAIIKCNKEWASLPESPYGQPVRTMAQAMGDFARYLEAEGGAPVPNTPKVPEITPTTPVPRRSDPIPIDPINAPHGEANMVSPALIPFALEALKVVVPKLGELFAGSDTAKRNVQAASAVIDVATQAIGARNAQEMVEAIETDKEAAATVKAAIEQNWYELTDLLIKAGEADEKSRAAATDRALVLANLTGGRWITFLGAVALLVVFMTYVITAGVLFLANSPFSDETKAMLLGQIVILGFSTVLGWLYGSNIQNRIAADANRQREREA
jgi:muramidase (phage lysozyme)